MGDFTSTVSSQIQRAINEAISDQVLPKVQAALMSAQGQLSEKRGSFGYRTGVQI